VSFSAIRMFHSVPSYLHFLNKIIA
jgi:hypothetical protein